MSDLIQSGDLAIAFGTLKETTNATTFLDSCNSPEDCKDAPPTVLVFPRFREASPDLEALAEFLWLQAINYVIPLRKRKHASNAAVSSSTGGDLSTMARLVRETKRAFIEYKQKYPNRASEVGELLAYIMALEFLQAAQIASKMALKTNANMPIHGLDGIHATFSGGLMTLYFLESKLAASANDGAREYAKSVAGFGTSRKQYLMEYEILSDLGNLGSLNEQEKNVALEYLDIYGAKKAHRIERSVGVICYSEQTHFANKLPKSKSTSPADHEDHFRSNYLTELEHHHSAVRKHLENNDVDPAECEVFFIAVPDVNKLRELFYGCMNG